MKIYISHSKTFDYKKELYDPIKKSELIKQYEFIFPHEEKDELFGSALLEKLKSVDLVIAEISYHSTAQGMELAWASILEKPVICIYKEGASISGSLHFVSKKLLMYTSRENMIADITGALEHYKT
jgi:hypothetical protein